MAPTEKVERPQFYRYANLVVKVYKGRLSAVTHRPDRRVAKYFNPLPPRWLEVLRREQAKVRRAEKLAALNVKWPEVKPGPWTDLSAATAVA